MHGGPDLGLDLVVVLELGLLLLALDLHVDLDLIALGSVDSKLVGLGVAVDLVSGSELDGSHFLDKHRLIFLLCASGTRE